MAQAYNHMIMPLATSRDKRTQVLWGIRDFESRFGRRPEGMWLPETAVDLETLDVLAGEGIRFTVLAPHQAAAARDLAAGGEWRDVGGGRIDPRRPYLCRLPSGRTIALFFYDGPIAHDVAFGGLLQRRRELRREARRRLLGRGGAGPSSSTSRPTARPTATTTASARWRWPTPCATSRRTLIAEVTIYGDYLERFPPTEEVEILENTSWSCAHGVERWRSDCGCSSGAHPGWNQEWRAPLREALDWLRDRSAEVFEPGLRRLRAGPVGRPRRLHPGRPRPLARVGRGLPGGPRRVAALSPEDKIRVLKLLELARHAMLIFTSCGWFFDDISNIETVQIIQYAARAMELVRDLGGPDLEPEFLGFLKQAKSNVRRHKNGAFVYETLVRPAVVDHLRLAAHFAVSSLFETYGPDAMIAHYAATTEARETKASGPRKLAVGRVRLRSSVTWEERTVDYAVLHLGDQNITAGVREHDGQDRFDDISRAIGEAFGRSDMAAVVRLIDKSFGPRIYTLWHLFTEEKRKVLYQILEGNLRGLEASFRQIFEANHAIMQAMRETQIPLPEALSGPAEYVLGTDLRRVMEGPAIDLEALRKVEEEYEALSFKPDGEALALAVSRKVGDMVAAWAERPKAISGLERIEAVLTVLKRLGVGLDLWRSQNIFFSTGKALYGKTASGESRRKMPAEWDRAFKSVGELLRIDTSVFLPTKSD